MESFSLGWKRARGRSKIKNGWSCWVEGNDRKKKKWKIIIIIHKKLSEKDFQFYVFFLYVASASSSTLDSCWLSSLPPFFCSFFSGVHCENVFLFFQALPSHSTCTALVQRRRRRWLFAKNITTKNTKTSGNTYKCHSFFVCCYLLLELKSHCIYYDSVNVLFESFRTIVCWTFAK